MSFYASSSLLLVNELAFIGGIFDVTRTERPKLQKDPSTWIVQKLNWLHSNEPRIRVTLLKHLNTRLESGDFGRVCEQIHQGLLPEHLHAMALAEHAMLCYYEPVLQVEGSRMLPVCVVMHPSCSTEPLKEHFQGVPYPLAFGLRHHRLVPTASGKGLRPGDVYLFKKLGSDLTSQWANLVDQAAREYRLGEYNTVEVTTEKYAVAEKYAIAEQDAIAKQDVEQDDPLAYSIDSLRVGSDGAALLENLEPSVNPFEPVARTHSAANAASSQTAPTQSSPTEDAVPKSLDMLTEWLETNMDNIMIKIPYDRNSHQTRPTVVPN